MEGLSTAWAVGPDIQISPLTQQAVEELNSTSADLYFRGGRGEGVLCLVAGWILVGRTWWRCMWKTVYGGEKEVVVEGSVMFRKFLDTDSPTTIGIT